MDLNTIRETCNAHISTAVRPAVGGFIVAGTINWLSKETGQPVAQQQDEAVADSPVTIAMYTARYFEYQTFDVDEADRRSTNMRDDLRKFADKQYDI